MKRIIAYLSGAVCRQNLSCLTQNRVRLLQRSISLAIPTMFFMMANVIASTRSVALERSTSSSRLMQTSIKQPPRLTRRTKLAPDSSYRNETRCLSPFHIVDHNKPRFVPMPSNDLFRSKDRGDSSWKVKLVKLGSAVSLAIVFTAVPLNAHKVTSDFELKPIPLPGASGVVSLDYFAYDRSTEKLWVPASNTGNVDVIDENSDAVSQVSGFKTGEVELRGRKVPLGPTAVSIGDGVVYIGNRGDSSLCVIDAQTLKREACLEVAPPSAGPAAAPDAVVYVAATKELWITTGAPPIGVASADKAIQVFDASKPSHLKLKLKIPLDGSAEGYAVDNQRGLFYTNIEEAGKTVAIDVRSHKVLAKWN